MTRVRSGYMTRDGEQYDDTEIQDALRDYCIRIVRFVSDGALDPHLYFETKYIGDVTVAESVDQLIGILIGLVDWIDETEGDSGRLSRFDRLLGRAGLPSLSLLCNSDTRSAGLILACSRLRSPEECRIARELTANDAVSDTDRSIAEGMLIAHERL